MEWKIIEAESFDYVETVLEPQDKVMIQSGAYFMHKGDVEVNAKAFGGIGASLKRFVLGGESFFINEFTGVSKSYVYLAPSMPGQIKEITLNDSEIIVKDEGYLASTPGIEITTKFIGLKGLFTIGGFFWLKLKGTGKALINSYGAMLEVQVHEGETLHVDNTHLVAYEPSVELEVKKLGNLKTFFFGGEGLIFKITGPGKIYLQTRNLYQLQANILKAVKK